MNIDVHTHYIPEELAVYLAEHERETGDHAEKRDGIWYITTHTGFSFPVTPEFWSMEKRLADMDAENLQAAVLSISPVLFFYDIDSKTALEICRLCNDWVYAFARKRPEVFSCMAMVPMQDITLAIEELDRAHQQLGMNAVEIAPVINGKMLDDPLFFPFYEYCEKNGILLYLHPAMTDRQPPYDKYHAMNLMGYVQETNWAVTRMMFGGVFDRFPRLNVLTSHGGGQFPYQFGRLMHGQQVRREAKEYTDRPLTDFLKNIYFDTITHWTPALQFLVDSFGAEHVLMGTDYPYDMADADPVSSVDALRLTREEREQIRAGNTCRLVGWHSN